LEVCDLSKSQEDRPALASVQSTVRAPISFETRLTPFAQQPCHLNQHGGDAPGLVASSPAINRIAAIFRMKLETGVGRPLHPHHVVSLVTVDGNIQDPVARRPSGQRAKFCHGVCGQRYTAFNLDLHFCGAAAETRSHFVQGFGRVSHRRFRFP